MNISLHITYVTLTARLKANSHIAAMEPNGNEGTIVLIVLRIYELSDQFSPDDRNGP